MLSNIDLKQPPVNNVTPQVTAGITPHKGNTEYNRNTLDPVSTVPSVIDDAVSTVISPRQLPSDHYAESNNPQVLHNPSSGSANTDNNKKTALEKAAEPIPSGGKKSMTLEERAREVIKRVPLISYDNTLFHYNGITYQKIESESELLFLIRNYISQDAFNSINISWVKDLMKYLQADKRLIPNNCDARVREARYYVPFRNGVLNLKNCKLMPHSKDYLTFFALDAEWHVQFKKPVHFLKYLADISNGDAEIQQRVLEVLGYLLTSINDGKVFFVMAYAPNSGKSTLGQLVCKLLGEKYTSYLSLDQLQQRFGLADIQGKMVNLSMDLPKGYLNPKVTSLIKQITGGDPITTERKYMDMKSIHSSMRFLFASNFPVSVSENDDDDAFWKRMVIVPFLYTIEKGASNPDFLSELLEETEGIIAMSMYALSRVIRNNYIFSKCEAADRLKSQWRSHASDKSRATDINVTLEVFVKECIAFTENPDDEVFTTDLYADYRTFCDRYGIAKANYNDFVAWFEHQGIPKKRSHHSRGENPRSAFIGIRLNPRT
ncbi:MAG: phage/plasmid primase, P4 family [Clostridiaceae bacterium]|nr:phage/plasmid primase, P4 family [Clostridiaceae bacterium]